MAKMALQMYTLRNYTENDMTGMLKKAAAMGYDGVELAGWGNSSPQEIRHVCDGEGIKVISEHVPMNLLTDQLDMVLDMAAVMGHSQVVCPYFVIGETYDEVKKTASILEGIGKKASEKGVNLAYHNHAHEMVKINGEHALDILYNSVSPDYLKTQIDVHWVSRAGYNPVEYITKYAGRYFTIHLKDMIIKEEGPFFAEVGEGLINMAGCVEAGIKGGVEWFIVEQDQCDRDTIESAALSAKNLSAILKG